MKKLMLNVFVFLCAAVFAACSNDKTSENENKARLLLERGNVDDSHEMIEQVDMHETTDANVLINESARKISYTAHIDVIIENMSETVRKVTELVQKEGGYIVSSDIHLDEKANQTGRLTVKIPQEKFQTFINQMEKMSAEIVSQNVQAQDVTEEYVDLRARLKAKQTVMKRLETFLQEANTTKDLLDVSEQIGKVQEEMEQIEGRLQFLENQIEYATVSISLTEKSLKVGNIGHQDQTTWVRAKQLFVTTINALLSFISSLAVVVIGLSPVIIPIVGMIIVIFIYRRKRKIKKEASRE